MTLIQHIYPGKGDSRVDCVVGICVVENIVCAEQKVVDMEIVSDIRIRIGLQRVMNQKQCCSTFGYKVKDICMRKGLPKMNYTCCQKVISP